MKFATKLMLLFAGLLGLAIMGTGLALWASSGARYHMERSDLAHRSYEAHLSLSNHTYQLFKQFGDAVMIGDRDAGALETELLTAIRRDIANIRQILAAEIALVGAEEVNELGHLAQIEAQIHDLLEEYQTVLDSGYAIPFSDEWGRLSRILDERVDRDFAQLIQAALDAELREVEEQRQITAARLRLTQRLALLAAALAVLCAGLASWWLLRDLKAPVGRLIRGAEALALGDRCHRIQTGGASELDAVAHAFNRMADEVVARESQLEMAKLRLEQAVAERTAELQGLLATLKEAEADRVRLLADVSHELRTPLTIIRGEADIALRGAEKAPADYRLALEKTRDAARHTARLVDDLLFVARRESGQTRLHVREMDLAELVPSVIADCRSLSEQHGGALIFVGGPRTAMLRGDPDRLRQVLIVLLDNGLRYGGGRVEVRLEVGPGFHRLQVSDQGPGLCQADLRRVFQRFYRGSNAARCYTQGSGLGLPVAKAIVEAHGGEIGLESSPGEGVRVTVLLPARPRLEAVS